MKKQLLILTVSMLCAWQATYTAAASSSVTVVTDDAAQPAEPVLTVNEFLRQIGIDPKKVQVTSFGYSAEDNRPAKQARAKLTHIEHQCKPLALALFVAQPTDAASFEKLVHDFNVAQSAISKLSERSFHSSKMTSISSSSSSSSTTSELKTLREIISETTEGEICSLYWNLLDEQPDTDTEGFIVTKEPRKPRRTISRIRSWLGAFKAAQAEDTVASTPEAFDEVFHPLFQARRVQIKQERQRIRAHVAQGIAALQELKIATQPMPQGPPVHQSYSGCKQQ